MAVDFTAELESLLDGSEVRLAPHLIEGDIDGSGKVVVCTGDLPVGSSVRNAKSLIINGDLIGHPTALTEIVCAETVIVLGQVVRAHIRANRLLISESVANAILLIQLAIEVGGDIRDSQVRLGFHQSKLDNLIDRHRDLQNIIPKYQQLSQDVENIRRSLNRLLQVTGVVFNLNIGKIVQQNDDGLQIDLKTFYEAVENRSEDEVDQALRQFFAKAVLGMLTRLNKDYIASGRGHQERFKKVVLKLQDLVFKYREYDKFAHQHRREKAQVEALTEQCALGIPILLIQGFARPSLEIAIHGVELEKEDIVNAVSRLEIEAGRQEGSYEVKVFRADKLLDMVFVPKERFNHIQVNISDKQIVWAPTK